MRFSLAFWVGFAAAWRLVGTEDALQRLWKRVAYATRYGHVGLNEALSIDNHKLQGFLDAVSELVAEENKASRR